MNEILPFVKLKFGPPTIVCWSRSDSFWIALMEISLMAILFSSSDDCRWPKIQFKKPEKMFFVSREFSRFVNFAFLRHFVIVLIIFVAFLMIFLYIFIIFLFLTLFWLSIFSSKINRWFSAKNWIIKKSSKNRNIDQNNEKTLKLIWFCCFSSLFFNFVKINYKSVLKTPFLDPGMSFSHSQ